MKTIFYLFLSICILISGASGEREVSLNSRVSVSACGFFLAVVDYQLGKTFVYSSRNMSDPLFSFDWIASQVFLKQVEVGLIVVRVNSAIPRDEVEGEVMIGFYLDDNVVREYKMGDLLVGEGAHLNVRTFVGEIQSQITMVRGFVYYYNNSNAGSINRNNLSMRFNLELGNSIFSFNPYSGSLVD